MSLFDATEFPCPACQTKVSFQAVHSVNADRRPDMRDAIIAGSFQREPCPKCGKAFRLDPKFNYLDVGRNQWFAVFSHLEADRWQENEDEVTPIFELAFGSKASAPAQELGANIKPRLVFGWPALWEKLAVDDHDLDDVQLELMKVGILKAMDESPLDLDTELRFLEVPENSPQELAMAWLDSQTAEVVQTMRVPRELYEEVGANPDAWKELRAELEASMFVDMTRLLFVGA